MNPRWKTYGLGFLFWTVVGLTLSGQQYLLLRPDVTWLAVLGTNMLMWYLWGLSAPCLFWLDRHLPYRTPRTYRVISRMILGAFWTAGLVVLYLVVLIPGPVSRVLQFGPWHYLVCLLILGVSIGRDYYDEARQRELDTVRLEKDLSDARLHLLRAQLNPHFLFNTLNTISSFVEEEPRRARYMMEQLGTMLRFSLDSANREEVSLGQEITYLQHYADILQARFGDQLTISITADPATQDALVPPFLLQPLVENAVHHGIKVRTAPGCIEVRASVEQDRLKLSVQDDGVGLAEGWSFDKHAGTGLQNTKARLRELYGEAFMFDLVAQPTGGTVALLNLPVRTASQHENARAKQRASKVFEAAAVPDYSSSDVGS